MRLCDTHGLAMVSLIDTPGFMVGPETEARAQVRHVSRMFVAAAQLRVPFLAWWCCARPTGLGAMAMAAGGFHARWPPPPGRAASSVRWGWKARCAWATARSSRRCPKASWREGALSRAAGAPGGRGPRAQHGGDAGDRYRHRPGAHARMVAARQLDGAAARRKRSGARAWTVVRTMTASERIPAAAAPRPPWWWCATRRWGSRCCCAAPSAVTNSGAWCSPAGWWMRPTAARSLHAAASNRRLPLTHAPAWPGHALDYWVAAMRECLRKPAALRPRSRRCAPLVCSMPSAPRGLDAWRGPPQRRRTFAGGAVPRGGPERSPPPTNWSISATITLPVRAAAGHALLSSRAPPQGSSRCTTMTSSRRAVVGQPDRRADAHRAAQADDAPR